MVRFPCFSGLYEWSADRQLQKSILVACDRPVWRGGFIRFERFGEIAKKEGHSLSFLPLAESRDGDRLPGFPCVSLADAKQQRWDATMIPGAGFADATIEQFAELRAANFGLRVQHILNDLSRYDKFLLVNRAFNPHLVVANNHHWRIADFEQFGCDELHFIVGAVDTTLLKPKVHAAKTGPFVIGGLANKNANLLMETVRSLPDTKLHLFGSLPALEHASDLLKDGRLKLFGMLHDAELPVFYTSLDCAVHVETAAGWSNLGAEALASGVPLICTQHGTLAFAENETSALVIGEPSVDAICAAVRRLQSDGALRMRLSTNGRRAIEPYSWSNYSAALLALLSSRTARDETSNR
jgi:glycosyltransferase involved in cell wall biosynthesis